MMPWRLVLLGPLTHYMRTLDALELLDTSVSSLVLGLC